MDDQNLAIGVDLGGTKIASAVVDGDDRIVFSSRRPTLGGRGPEPIIRDLVEVIREAIAESGREEPAIGVAVCGQVASGSGVVRASPNLAGWHDVPVRDRLEEALGLPVAVANDGHLIALGEWRAAPEGEDPLVAVYVGTGVGGGVVIGGKPFLGHGGYAAELGHMTIVMQGRECRCGNRGCLEAYVGGWAVAERAREAVEAPTSNGAAILEEAGAPERVGAEAVARAYRRGDPLAGQIVLDVGRDLGAGLVGIVNAFNPRRLVLGGGVVEGIPDLVEVAARHLRVHALAACLEDLEIVPTSRAVEAGVIGAAAYARTALPRSDME